MYEVKLRVEIKAFSPDDAEAVVEETFGVGDNCGALVTEATYTLKKVK